MDKKKRIIAAYEKGKVVKEVYPSVRDIAHRVGVSPAYVHQVLAVYKAQKQAFGLN